MRAVLRGLVRLLFRSPVSAASTLGSALALGWFIVAFTPLLGAVAMFVPAITYVAAFGFPAFLWGPAITPAGPDPFGWSMPALPAAPWQRSAAVVLMGEVILGGATLAFMSLGHPLAALSEGASGTLSLARFAALAVCWIPFFVLGDRMGGALTGVRLLFLGVICSGAAWAGVDQSLARAVAFAGVATPLASRATRPRFVASSRPMRAVRPGLGGLLRATVLQSAALALGLSVLTWGALRVGGMGPGAAVVTPALAWMMVVLLPILPPASIPGQLAPLTPEACFRLPVSRTRTTLLLGLAGAVRALGVCGLLAVALGGGWPARDATTLGFAAVWVGATGALGGMVGALPGTRWALAAWAPMAMVMILGFDALLGGRAPIVWAGSGLGLVGTLAAGVLLLSSGRLGWTPRRVG